MITYEIAAQWAKALLNLTHSEEHMVSCKEILTQLGHLWKSTPQFSHLFLNPQICMEEKKNILQKGIDDAQLIRFLFLLLEKRRFKYLPEIARKYTRMVMKRQEIVEVTWITARIPRFPSKKCEQSGLDSDLQSKIKEFLEKNYTTNTLKMIMNEKISPQIIGGAILIVDNKILDLSIRGRLAHMKNTLLEHRSHGA